MQDLNSILENVKLWVKEAGQIQRENLGKANLLVATKSSVVDLVTEVDKLTEEYLLKAITGNYPSHRILSEESGKLEKSESDYLWIIDPLDGTTNYAQGLPIFAISVALKYKEETVLGVIYVPMLDLLFEAVRGQKAYLNGKRITVGNKKDLNQCLLSTGFPYDRADNSDNNASYFAHFIPKTRGLRRLGSAAYDLGNVAAGILDGYWEFNLKPWDVAAGVLIVEEAGGKVVYLTEKRGVSLVAGNEAVCDLILKEMRLVDEMNKKRETGKREDVYEK